MEKKISKTGKKVEYQKLAFALLVLLGIALGLTLALAWPLITGKAVILQTMPVDPFDMFRGQYLAINYEISNIPIFNGAKEGSKVYVSLEKGNDQLWHYSFASMKKPKEGIFIAGKVAYIFGEKMRVEYGIEQYFFERNADVQISNLTVEVKISSSGNARISQVFYKDSPMEIKYRQPS